MNYGIPYMGSKSKICADVCSLFPKADHFYDLFGGGFSITHYMLIHRHKDFKEFHFNEIRPGMCNLIQKAIAGHYSDENFKIPWVSRDEFHKLKNVDPFIKMIWSFGNNGKTYLYSGDIEAYKKSMHYAVVFNDFDETAEKILGMKKFSDGYSITERRLFLHARVDLLMKNKTRSEQNTFKQLQQLQQLQQLERLEHLEGLERLQQLERSKQNNPLNFYNNSYEKVVVKENSIIYCDIPYENTEDYDNNKHFNRKIFLDWADNQANPVFISEYNIADSRFKCVFSKKKRSKLNIAMPSPLFKDEKVYANKAACFRLYG